jgi:hypothetical protein
LTERTGEKKKGGKDGGEGNLKERINRVLVSLLTISGILLHA